MSFWTSVSFAFCYLVVQVLLPFNIICKTAIVQVCFGGLVKVSFDHILNAVESFSSTLYFS